MIEQWRDIKDYEGFYQVSNLGNVRSLDRNLQCYFKGKPYIKLRKGSTKVPQLTDDGYYEVGLYKNGKGKAHFVHRLVASSFIENTDNLPQVNHIDGNKLNNCVSNLEWCTAKENTNHAIRIGLRTSEMCRINGRKTKVPVIDLSTGIYYESMVEAARATNMNESDVSQSVKTGCYARGRKFVKA